MADNEAPMSAEDQTAFDKVVAEHPACNLCGCGGFSQGNPSTSCRNCGHDWQQHNH